MNLSTYCKTFRASRTSIARACGADYCTVRQWVIGARIPRPHYWPLIERATDGQVTASDWVTAAVKRKRKRKTARKAS